MAVPAEQAVVACAFCLLLFLTRQYDAFLAHIGLVRLFEKIGAFSYSLYLTHMLVIGIVAQIGKRLGVGETTYWLSMIAQTLVALPTAWIFFQIAERPFMSRRALRRCDTELQAKI